MSQPRVAIVGAGLTGLSIARQLRGQNMDITLFDKSRGVSGRMATRRLTLTQQTLRFDHGVPGLTSDQAVALAALAEPTNPPLDALLPRGANTPPDTTTAKQPLRTVPEGVNQIGKWLAGGLDVQLQATVASAHQQAVGAPWRLSLAENTPYPDAFDLLVLTTPPHQAANILTTNGSPFISNLIAAELIALKPQGCWTAMWVTSTQLTGPVLVHPNSEIVERIVCEHQKGRDCGDLGVYTLQAHRSWSQQRIDTEPRQVGAELQQEIESSSLTLGHIMHQQMHRWLYAGVQEPLGRPCLVDRSRKLICAGDWCLGNDIDSALSSAAAAVAEIRQMIC